MTYRFDLIVPGDPVGKGRPRMTTRAGFAHAYSPPKTVDAEKRIQTAFKAVYRNYEPIAKGTPIRARIKAFYAEPASMSKTLRNAAEAGLLKPTKKPDLDNVVKLILDALNGLAYEDDSSICSIEAEKYYSTEPRIMIEIVCMESCEVV